MKSRRSGSLSSKLLWLTIAFVMLAEVMIFVPSVANFRKNWLLKQLEQAELMAQAIDVAGVEMLPPSKQKILLNAAMVEQVIIYDKAKKGLELRTERSPSISGRYNLCETGFGILMRDGLKLFFAPGREFIEVTGFRTPKELGMLSVVMQRAPLKEATMRFALNILALSILISLITAALVFLSLKRLFVVPMQMLTRQMIGFRANPHSKAHIIKPTGREDEIGVAEQELEMMEEEIYSALVQKKTLTDLGLAVSKINHDLRNILGTAQLVSDGLTQVKDPVVKKIAPRLVSSIDRAIALCTRTLEYGKISEIVAEKVSSNLKTLVEDSVEIAGIKETAFTLQFLIESDAHVWGDREQLMRVFSNLLRNAVQHSGVDHPIIRIEMTTADEDEHLDEICVLDNGVGLNEQVMDTLFEAFSPGKRGRSTGLGLAIAREILQAHGGDLTVKILPKGAGFLLRLPRQPKT